MDRNAIPADSEKSARQWTFRPIHPFPPPEARCRPKRQADGIADASELSPLAVFMLDVLKCNVAVADQAWIRERATAFGMGIRQFLPRAFRSMETYKA